ncbi:Eco57I restriction-modification methylase domain-containing protein [Halobacillus amylolyticus]|uniref:site-specific DNA-methyltransferase (adenine-specific) n=1 Tax=Halobacillus amylolyticus TaxID=2932259 RepID=A0ABY4H884_9BACI|nr:N-6 DNA methylase [Halobacillus amylolyticus]UOR11078.1 Eco57I restriction-modification methylase domain-containing protein [Halobacillus amylolyticus]
MLSYQRSMGQYDTPISTVKYMVKTVLQEIGHDKRPPLILDPSTGDGVFVKSLIEEGQKPSHIHAYDIDHEVSLEEFEVQFTHQDFLKARPSQLFDAVIGNPPYKSKRQSTYFREHKDELEKEFKEIGVHNMYTLFIYKGLQLLKENGILCMIVQDSFLTNVYYTKFREYLLKNTEILEVTLAPRKLFHSGKADVRTAIITIKKGAPASRHQMKLVDRLATDDYETPPSERVQYLPQSYFHKMPNFNFAINVPLEILSLFITPAYTLVDKVDGGTGISTGNDKVFLRKPWEIDTKDKEWIPFYKNSGIRDRWYYEPKHYIHKNWKKYSQAIPNFTVRNQQYFYREGITCSSMGIDFQASYLPAGSLFGVNTNLFTENDEDLYYILGLLNSSLTTYMLRKVLNRTNMITSGYIKKLPYIEPPPQLKRSIAKQVENIVSEKKKTLSYDSSAHQQKINDSIFDVYQISPENRKHVTNFCDMLIEML